MQPKTLSEAFELIKNEKTTDCDQESPHDLFALNKPDFVSIPLQKLHDIQREIKQLQRQVEQLTKEIRQPATSKRNYRDQWQQQRGNSNAFGKTRCFSCNGFGHMARQCNFRRDNQKFRHIEVKADSIASEPQTEEIERSSDIVNEIKDCDDPSFDDKQGKREQQRCQRVYSVQVKSTREKKHAKYPEDVIALGNYIEGRGPKPRYLTTQKSRWIKQCPPTTISSTRSELAVNKPVVECRVDNDFKVAALFDSGAESNVVDSNFLKSIQKIKGSNAKFIKKNGSLQCANGSLMRVLGYAVFSLEIGTALVRSKYCVVDSIFPKVIIGMRTMARERISIDPSNKCLRVDGIHIPFKSTKNEIAPFRRV